MKELFQPGQEVICLKDHRNWKTLNMDERFFAKYDGTPPQPKKNEIYTVAESLACEALNTVFISLKEFPDDLVFNQKAFAPVMPSTQLASELDAIFQLAII